MHVLAKLYGSVNNNLLKVEFGIGVFHKQWRKLSTESRLKQ